MRITAISQRDAYMIMLKDYPDVMTAAQVCEVLGIGTKTCYRLLKEGRIECLKIGKIYRIPKAHLFSYLCIGAEKNEPTSSQSNRRIDTMQSQVDCNDVLDN